MIRESLYDISWKVSEEEYRANPAYSYSTLSRFNREGFSGLKNLFDKIDSNSLLFGSIVDTLRTGGIEEFNDKYLVAMFPSVADTIINIVKATFQKLHTEYQTLESIPDKILFDFIEDANYQSNWKPETRVKVTKEKGAEYYNLLHLSKDKIVVNQNDYNDGISCVQTLEESPATKFYFAPINPFDDSVERFYQLKFKAIYQNIPVRCMLDLVLVNHTDKVIIPCDLKTSYKKEYEFPKSFIDWGYWIQAQLYWWILKENLNKHPLYKDYVLLDFRFIVISRFSKLPLVWEYEDTKAETTCIYGKQGEFKCKNWRELLVDLNFYLTKNPIYPIGISYKNKLKYWLNE